MIQFKEYLFVTSLDEASYPGNIGIMELVKFYNTAHPDKVKHVKQLIKDQKHKEAWDVIQDHVGVKLHTSVVGEAHSEMITEQPQLVASDTPEKIASDAIGLRNLIKQKHSTANNFDKTHKYHHLQLNKDTHLYYRHDGVEPKEMSYISKNIQTGTEKGKDGDSAHIHAFMMHHLQNNHSIESSNSNTNGSKKLWTNFIKKNPNLNHSAINTITNKSTKLTPENVDTESSKIWGSDSKFANIRIVTKK